MVVSCDWSRRCGPIDGGRKKVNCKQQREHMKPEAELRESAITYSHMPGYVGSVFLFHAWRLPVPSLWLDIFQKVKALGFNAVSTYINWSLIEATKGTFELNGIFAYDAFFQAAKEAGLYIIVRPGPYINAELSAGGLPGWRFHAPEGVWWRINNQSYYNEIQPYVQTVGQMLVPYSIDNGGPIILLQLENELSGPAVGGTAFPPTEYMGFLANEFASAGLTVPTFHNDVSHGGVWAHDNPPNVYAYDQYPIPCGTISTSLQQNDYNLYLQYASNTPHMVAEFAGGFYDQIFGGTNWGHIGWDEVYTSYDYRAAIREDRSITREKYAEIKLENQFLKVSPSTLTSRLVTSATPSFTNTSEIVVTKTWDNITDATYWTSRHSSATDTSNVTFTLTLDTSQGNYTIPQLGGALSMAGYDSKIHVTNYPAGDVTLLYSSGEILSWKKYGSTTFIFIYGNPGELHETAVLNASGNCDVLEGAINKCVERDSSIIVNYFTTGQNVVSIGSDIVLYLLDRPTAYQYWFPDLSTTDVFQSINTDSPTVKGPYLVRSASISGDTLSLTGDLNTTVNVEFLAPPSVTNFEWNGANVATKRTTQGSYSGTLQFTAPNISMPNLANLAWKSIDSLPEIQNSYSDALWISASNTTTVNEARSLTTPTSLYAGDYGYHVGNILYRGHFTATGNETAFFIQVCGGYSFGFAVWLNETFLGGNYGGASSNTNQETFQLGPITAGKNYVLTVVTQNQGYNENDAGGITYPRGILNYNFVGSNAPISWKITGNLGGEEYVDKTRGPMNEGGLYAERQGWHQPSPPSATWASSSPLTGISYGGVEFYTTTFDLGFPEGYDIPLAITIQGTPWIRVQIYVNGYQFGVYESNIGPQTVFPIPQGIINHSGKNTLAISLWAFASSGGSITQLSLNTTGTYQTGYKTVESVPQPSYTARPNAF
ncbi:hypothetical protein ZTR_11010 [Talaromyces verruculosus]|nr:hypothetical protein ZTR_11010 [Talaromyces verruculosus]